MSFGMAYATKKRGKKMAKGGDVRPEEVGDLDIDQKDSDLFKKTSGAVTRSGIKGYRPDMGSDPNNFAEADVWGDDNVIGNMKAKRAGYAEGGEVDSNMDDADMIARIMHKRKEYSQGGMVANDVGVAEADKLPAEYDDLVLRDDLEDTSGPGNEIGDEAHEDRDSDVISKIMSSRKKKDRNPRPA